MPARFAMLNDYMVHSRVVFALYDATLTLPSFGHQAVHASSPTPSATACSSV